MQKEGQNIPAQLGEGHKADPRNIYWIALHFPTCLDIKFKSSYIAKNENQIYLIYKEIQSGAVAKS